MNTRGNNRTGSSNGGSGGDVPSAMELFRMLMEQQRQQNEVRLQQDGQRLRQDELLRQQSALQQEQITLLREGLLTAQRTAVAAVDRATTPQGQRVGTLTDFMRMLPAAFTGTETPLAAEQWLTDMTNLLEGANVPEADRVKMIKLRFTDVARTWWLAEEAKLPAPITWKQLSDGFYERFFPKTARRTWKSSSLRYNREVGPWTHMQRSF